jgi:hypothetical protein
MRFPAFRSITLFFPVILLSSCFGSTDVNVNLTEFTGSGFVVQVPKTWTEVGQRSLPNPKEGKVVAAFTSTEITAGFANNLLILKDTLSSSADPEMNSRKYAVVNQALTTGTYKEYLKITDKKITFADAEEWLAVVFEAKYNNDTPKQKFIQSAKICGKDVYLMTIGLGLSNDATEKYMAIFESFSCK